jgi:serine/threonine kinase 32
LISFTCCFQCLVQSRKANFDASHELEELLLEDNPLKAKRRKEQDISNLSAEMRQMEEQCVMGSLFAPLYLFSLVIVIRFTNYDFKKMQRRSYYPQNQIVSTMTATSSTGINSSRPVTPGNDQYPEHQVQIGTNGAAVDADAVPNEYGETERYEGIPMSKVISEKDYRT